MRSVRELQEALQTKRLSVEELTREECFALFEAWTEDFRHGHLQDGELFLACAERIRSFGGKEKPNEGARLVKPERELRGQIAAEREKQARATRRTIPLLATACVLVVCSAFAIAAGVRAVSPQAHGVYDGIPSDSVCGGKPSELDCVSEIETSGVQVLEATTGDEIASTAAAEQPSCGAESADMQTEESYKEPQAVVSTEASYPKDLNALQASAEALFGRSPMLPWSMEEELQAANGILIDGREIILHTEDMQLQITSDRHMMETNSSDESTDVSDGSMNVGESYGSAGVQETSEWMMIDTASADDGRPHCYVLYRNGFCYRITVRDAETFEAVRDALGIDE